MIKLTDSQVIEIVRRYNAGERALTLAEEFDVNQKTVLTYVRYNDKDVSQKPIRTADSNKSKHKGSGFRLIKHYSYDQEQQERRQKVWEELQ